MAIHPERRGGFHAIELFHSVLVVFPAARNRTFRFLRRSNWIAIAILAFFAIGLLVIALLPENTTGLALASRQSQPGVGKAAPPVHHVR